MNARFLLATLASVLMASAAQAAGSRLRYTSPDRWELRPGDANTVPTLVPPGGGASVSFAESVAFAGTAEQWQQEVWSGIVQEMPLASPAPVPGKVAEFQSMMAVLKREDGVRPWVCLFTLLKNGQGEAVFFAADGEKQFFEHLPAVTKMMIGITIADGRGPQRATSPIVRAATGPAAPNANPGSGQGLGAIATGGPASPPSASMQTAPVAPPELMYSMSPDFLGRPGAGSFVAKGVDGFIHIYDFRPYRGNFEEEFRRTLLREWVAADVREDKLVGAPNVQSAQMPGTEKVMMARFRQDYWGTARERLRVALQASGHLAIVDINIKDMEAWQRYQPGISTFLDSLKVRAADPIPAAGPGGFDVAGLWLANKSQFNPNVLGGVGSGSFQMGTEFYLLSPEGRAYRGRKLPKAPGGDIRRFDFAGAQGEDPQNSGNYFVRGDQIVIRLGPPPHETITATRPARDVLSIYDVPFKRDVQW